MDASDPQERFKLENKLIKELQLKDITSVEYWACLEEHDIEFNFSIGRILDRFYSEHWDEIKNDDDQLRLFLKKAEKSPTTF